MATSIVMPQMGYDMQQGTVVRWRKKEGESVARGEVIAEIETDKATVEFEAYTSGVLRRIVVDEGVAIPVGDLIAIITDPDEQIPDDLAAAATGFADRQQCGGTSRTGAGTGRLDFYTSPSDPASGG